MAIVTVILDGAGDVSHRALAGKTPLEVAQIPNLDSIAAEGRSSLVQILPDGSVPQTHSGVLSLLGYWPEKADIRRGPLEALGHFEEVPPGAICARCNFSSLVDGMVPSRRVNRDVSQAEADALVRDLATELKTRFREEIHICSISTYRLSLLIKGSDTPLSAEITNTDPGYATNADFAVPETGAAFRPVLASPTDGSESARYTASLINKFVEFSHQTLSVHPINRKRVSEKRLPANFILCRDFGTSPPRLPSFQRRYGISGTYFYELPIERGIARVLRITGRDIRIIDKTVHEYRHLGKLIVEAKRDCDFLLCHVKGPDEPGHDQDWKAKVAVLERIDEGLMRELLDAHNRVSDLIVVTSDHATPWSIGTHTSDPVALSVAGKGIVPDRCSTYSEKACAEGDAPVRHAGELMPFLLQLSGQGSQSDLHRRAAGVD